MEMYFGGTVEYKTSIYKGRTNAVEIYDASTQTVSSGAETKLLLDTVRWGDSDLHDSSNNRAQTPVAGIYLVIGRVLASDSTTGTYRHCILVRLNSSDVEQERIMEGISDPAETANFYMEIPHILKCDADDHLELRYKHDKGSNMTIGHATNKWGQSALAVILLART
jgi:hypothetical protein